MKASDIQLLVHQECRLRQVQVLRSTIYSVSSEKAEENTSPWPSAKTTYYTATLICPKVTFFEMLASLRSSGLKVTYEWKPFGRGSSLTQYTIGVREQA